MTNKQVNVFKQRHFIRNDELFHPVAKVLNDSSQIRANSKNIQKVRQKQLSTYSTGFK